jgi:hypothetical protein
MPRRHTQGPVATARPRPGRAQTQRRRRARPGRLLPIPRAWPRFPASRAVAGDQAAPQYVSCIRHADGLPKGARPPLRWAENSFGDSRPAATGCPHVPRPMMSDPTSQGDQSCAGRPWRPCCVCSEIERKKNKEKKNKGRLFVQKVFESSHGVES